MTRGKFLLLLTTAFFLFIPAKGPLAITLLMEDEALNEFFPTVDEIIQQKFVINPEKLQRITDMLGGKFVHALAGKDADLINRQKEFIFYLGKKEGKLLGVALVIEEPGKWGPIKFMVQLSPGGDIMKVVVMEYKEVRGRLVASFGFLKQFVGKNIDSEFKLGKDIQAISGATVSSEAACFAMKKALVLYRELNPVR